MYSVFFVRFTLGLQQFIRVSWDFCLQKAANRVWWKLMAKSTVYKHSYSLLEREIVRNIWCLRQIWFEKAQKPAREDSSKNKHIHFSHISINLSEAVFAKYCLHFFSLHVNCARIKSNVFTHYVMKFERCSSSSFLECGFYSFGIVCIIVLVSELIKWYYSNEFH